VEAAAFRIEIFVYIHREREKWYLRLGGDGYGQGRRNGPGRYCGRRHERGRSTGRRHCSSEHRIHTIKN
jgi:hypothetical protein